MLISPLFYNEKERRIIKKWKAFKTDKCTSRSEQATLRESGINPNTASQSVQGSVSMFNDKPDDSLEISAMLRLIYQPSVCTNLCFKTFHSSVCDLSTFVPELVCTSLTNGVVPLTVHHICIRTFYHKPVKILLPPRSIIIVFIIVFWSFCTVFQSTKNHT